MNRFHEQSSKTIRTGIVLLMVMLIGGTLGFRFLEDYRWIDSIYMTVITISTVGFSEVKPLSDAGHLFTSVLIVFSLSSLAYVGYLARFIFDGDFLKYYRSIRVENRIQRLYNHIIICGYGRIGEQVGKELSSHNASFVVIDSRESVLERLDREHPEIMYIEGDATHEDVLRKAGVERAKALIATTPGDAENVFVVLTARSLNPKIKIISRAVDKHSDEKLKRAGADNVIMPEIIGGQRMAKLIAQPDVVEFLEYIMLQQAKEVSMEEIKCAEMASIFTEKSVAHLKQRDISGTNIIGVKDKDGRYHFNPGSEYILSREDCLFVLGSPEQIYIFRKSLEEGD